LALSSSGCNDMERDKVAPSPAATPAATPTEVAPSPSAAPEWLAAGATHRVIDIVNDPNDFFGKTVTVVAEIDDVYGPRAFTLDREDEDSSGAEDDGNDLLTLIPKVGGFPNVDDRWEGDKARVTGVVQRMTPEYIEREIGWALPSSLESRFRGKPALIVRSVERLAN
ncbi:MAG TPA: hypothetical protein VIM99_07485, partial [Blastocatellia bacterium]